MPNLTKEQILFIRACKSNNGLQRVKSVYRRFYCKGFGHIEQRRALISILLDICDMCCPIRAVELVNRLNPDSLYVVNRYDDKYNYEVVLLDFLVEYISLRPNHLFTNATDTEGYNAVKQR